MHNEAGQDRAGGGLGRTRLVRRFAILSLVVFVATGAGVTFSMARNVRDRAEDSATFHAQFAAQAVLAPSLSGVDLSQPLTGETYERLHSLVEDHILSDGLDVRVKIWNRSGVVIFSDYRPIVGRTFAGEAEDLDPVFEGKTLSSVSDLAADENVGERTYGKLFQTYVPLRLTPGGPVVAAAEVSQRYSGIQSQIDSLVRQLAITFTVALMILYSVLLPIMLRASKALRRQNAELADQAGKLRELLEREQETVAELIALSRMKDDFVSTASHELRTPITVILGYAKTLRQTDLSANKGALDEALAKIEGQAERLSRLVRDLLTESRVEQRDLSVHITRFDLTELIHEVSGTLEGAEARVIFSGPPEGLVIESDRERLLIAVDHLLSNALEFSDGKVDVRAERQGSLAKISVHDEGIGIAPDQHKRIFERFYQVDQSSTRMHGGVGLGLHLASEMIAALGGSIELQSALERGSTFTITFPAGEVQEPLEDESSKAEL